MAAVLIALLSPVAAPVGAWPSAPDRSSGSGNDVAVFAHFYIWFEASSWNRAKIDTPLIGRYSSDESSVMEEQIIQAKAAGIDGFIVSWKSTDALNERLAQLVRIAEKHDFKLAITYQGLDFNRDPLPVARVAADLDLLIERYAHSPALHVGDRPLVAWTGTWDYSIEDIASVTQSRRAKLRILATAKSVDDYQRVAGAVDGNLYYWSSVDPSTNTGHVAKLAEMSAAVHANDGMWVAPVAPGFDARLVGGKSVVERENGETMRREWSAAMASSPDMVGIISWNEFSENTQIEPSRAFGEYYLDVVRDLTKTPTPREDFGSESEADPTRYINLGVIGLFAALLVVCTVAVRRRVREEMP